MPKLLLLAFFAISTYAIEPFPEQTPLQMTTPSINKEQPTKWIPLSPVVQETPIKSANIASKSIDETIKNQIQKKMQTLLKPLKDDEDER